MELIGQNSRFDPGYKGAAHGLGLAIGSDTTVEVSGCDSECRRCKIRGPVRSDPAVKPVVAQRCLDDISKTCTADAECPSGRCRFMFPPISSVLIVPTCAIVYFEPPATGVGSGDPMQGVIDLATGELDMSVMNMAVKVVLEQCKQCNGDPATFDGIKGGTCSVGGTACDVNGIGTKTSSFTSFDCPVSAGGITIPLPANGTTTGSRAWTLDSTRPKCTSPTGTAQRCWCGMCSNGDPCQSNSNCPNNTTCGAATGPGNVSYVTANHACASPGTCVWDPAVQRGHCSNAATTPCFPDAGTIVATGAAEVHDGYYISQLANLICMPPFGDALIDGVAGFPGPLFFQSRFRISPRTASP